MADKRRIEQSLQVPSSSLLARRNRDNSAAILRAGASIEMPQRGSFVERRTGHVLEQTPEVRPSPPSSTIDAFSPPASRPTPLRQFSRVNLLALPSVPLSPPIRNQTISWAATPPAQQVTDNVPVDPFVTSPTEVMAMENINPSALDRPVDAPVAPTAKEPVIPWPGIRYADDIVRRAPLAFVVVNTIGTYLYLLGGTAIERGFYATRPVNAPPDGAIPGTRLDVGSDPIDRPRPDRLGVLRTPAMAQGLGAAGVIVGASMAMFVFWRYWLDGIATPKARGLPRAARARPDLFFAAQMLAVPLALYFRAFNLEALRDHDQLHAVWGSVVVGSLASGVFAAIQAQSISSSESLRGPIFVRHRNLIARSARVAYGVGLRCLSYVVGQKASAPARQALRLSSFASLSIAYAMPLTLVRLNPTASESGVGAYRQQEETTTDSSRWRLPSPAVPPVLLGIYILGQGLGGLFAVPISKIAVDGELGAPSMTFSKSSAQFWAAIAGVAVGISLECVALYFMYRDARRHAQMVARRARLLPGAAPLHQERQAFAFFAGAVASSMCLMASRIATETAKLPLSPALEGVATTLGAVSGSLKHLCVPELYAYSQVVRGRTSFPYIQDALVAARFTGSVLADAWVVAANYPSFQVVGRDALSTASSFCTLIGVGVPTGVAYHESALQFGQTVDDYLASEQANGVTWQQARRGSSYSWIQNETN